jgi:hypothetical protein
MTAVEASMHDKRFNGAVPGHVQYASAAAQLEEDLPSLDFVITVCDKAAGEQYSEWPGQPAAAHWNLPARAAAEGGETHRS